MFLSVILPAYNEEKNLSTLLKELEHTIAATPNISQYEIIICDDHSTDNTIEFIKSLRKKNIKAIRLSRRSGSHTALRAGLSIAKGDAALCISADGQDNPQILASMVAKLKEGYHTIWGLRKTRKEPLMQKITAALFYKLLQSFFQKDSSIKLANADFFLLDRKVINAINQCNERNTSLFGLIIWLGFKQSFVEYERRERISGKSKWSFKSKLKLMQDWVFSFSDLPLKLISITGIVLIALGFISSVIHLLFPQGHQGCTSSVTTSLFSTGIQLLVIGLLGEYVWRTFDETRKRPLFFIEEETEKTQD